MYMYIIDCEIFLTTLLWDSLGGRSSASPFSPPSYASLPSPPLCYTSFPLVLQPRQRMHFSCDSCSQITRAEIFIAS